MTYSELDLKKIREDNGLDFAHFTYKRGQCSCCYGPWDLPARYWHNGEIPDRRDGISYILFKNADNGSGHVTKSCKIENNTCIEWSMTDEQLTSVCADLQHQLGAGYSVEKPKDKSTCIIIHADERA
jgi:hypothetical protein